jgi:hypothetical protein
VRTPCCAWTCIVESTSPDYCVSADSQWQNSPQDANGTEEQQNQPCFFVFFALQSSKLLAACEEISQPSFSIFPIFHLLRFVSDSRRAVAPSQRVGFREPIAKPASTRQWAHKTRKGAQPFAFLIS